MRKRISRRTVLRGMAGGALVNVGLPCLAVMLNGNGTAHADMTPLLTRFGVWFWGNGILPPRWVPTTTGPAWELTEQLTPFAALKSSISVITGTAVKVQGSAHGNGLCGILTGAGCKGPGQEDIVNVLPSIDQLVAPQIRGGTRLGSIQAGAVTQIADSQFGAALYHTSYPAAATYNQAEFECGALFDRLFGGVTEVGDPRAKLRSSVLDIVTGDINDLLKQVGTEDRTRLEQHLTSVRDLELQIGSVASTRQCQLPQRAALKSPYNQPDDRVDDIMSDLFAYALACDITRVFTYQYMEPGQPVNLPGLPDEFHNLCHTEAGDQPTVNQYIVYTMQRLARFLGKLQALPEGTGTLLDACGIMATSELSDGRSHSTDEFPILLAGRANGRLKTGFHFRAEGMNASKVPFTLARAVGANLTAFGKDEGYVTEPISDLVT